jgi:hypothetical protein
MLILFDLLELLSASGKNNEQILIHLTLMDLNYCQCYMIASDSNRRVEISISLQIKIWNYPEGRGYFPLGGGEEFSARGDKHQLLGEKQHEHKISLRYHQEKKMRILILLCPTTLLKIQII